MSDAATFAAPPARVLPVLVLADESGSMGVDGKAGVLAASLRALAAELAARASDDLAVELTVIAFGGEAARIAQPPVAACAFAWAGLEPAGRTPLGSALALARAVLEDERQVPRNALRPLLLLVCDGFPTDDWRPALAELLASERAAAALRVAIAIGADADRVPLRGFVGDPEAHVLEAPEVRDVADHLQCAGAWAGRAAAGAPHALDALDLPPLPDFEALDA